MAGPQTLRVYQESAVHRVFASWRDDGRCVLLVLPTGGGKTSVFSWIAANLNVPVLILVHRRELATQAANRLREFGVDFGMIMAGEKPRPSARVQIASVQTLVRRVKKGQIPGARLVIADEAHLSTAETWRTVLECYPTARILGVTATPWRLSGKPLVGTYNGLVVGSTPRELREAGFLCPYNGFSYLAPDLEGVKTTAGEFNESQSAAAAMAPAIVNDIVEKWLKYSSHLSTLMFAVTREHSKEVCAQFVAAGVRAEHLDGTMAVGLRDAILARLASGATQVVCNVGIAVEGLDVPRVKCIVDGAPTMSLARAIQKWGRGRRPWGGLTLRIHDHAFNIARHGLPDADRDYALSSKPEKLPALKTCNDCKAVFEGPKCPACGVEPDPKMLGERTGPAKLDEAEQVDFSSDDGLTPEQRAVADTIPEADKVIRTVELRWTDPREIEGVFESTFVQDTQWGPRKIYMIQSERYRYAAPGTSVLDTLWARAKVKPGDKVRIRYIGEMKNGTHMKKLFDLGVDRTRGQIPDSRVGVSG